MSTPDFLDSVQQELEQAEGRLAAVEKALQQLEQQVAKERSLIAAYRIILQHRSPNETVPPTDLWGQPSVTPPTTHIPKNLKQPGNRSSLMPPRQPQYTSVSVGHAVLNMLRQSKENVHSDIFAKAIWQIESSKDLTRVKRTLNSTLGRLVERKEIERTEQPGKYKGKAQQTAAVAGS
ncbi:MAG: hypothetical protein HYU30_09505 [Chloroflexi bacterium]|nr:hypothetical protein [Chloroflexota bacterium]